MGPHLNGDLRHCHNPAHRICPRLAVQHPPGMYADDSTFGGTAMDIAAAMRIILAKGPTRGYYPEPSKSVLICNPTVHASVMAELADYHFQYEDRYHHVGRFIGTPEAKA